MLRPAPMPLPFDTAVGEVRRELPELPAALAPRTTRIARMSAALLQALEEPLRQARERWRPERIAVILGTSTAGAETTERAYDPDRAATGINSFVKAMDDHGIPPNGNVYGELGTTWRETMRNPTDPLTPKYTRETFEIRALLKNLSQARHPTEFQLREGERYKIRLHELEDEAVARHATYQPAYARLKEAELKKEI